MLPGVCLSFEQLLNVAERRLSVHCFPCHRRIVSGGFCGRDTKVRCNRRAPHGSSVMAFGCCPFGEAVARNACSWHGRLGVMGAAPRWAAALESIRHGRRKPSEYETALGRKNLTPTPSLSFFTSFALICLGPLGCWTGSGGAGLSKRSSE